MVFLRQLLRNGFVETLIVQVHWPSVSSLQSRSSRTCVRSTVGSRGGGSWKGPSTRPRPVAPAMPPAPVPLSTPPAPHQVDKSLVAPHTHELLFMALPRRPAPFVMHRSNGSISLEMFDLIWWATCWACLCLEGSNFPLSGWMQNNKALLLMGLGIFQNSAFLYPFIQTWTMETCFCP